MKYLRNAVTLLLSCLAVGNVTAVAHDIADVQESSISTTGATPEYSTLLGAPAIFSTTPVSASAPDRDVAAAVVTIISSVLLGQESHSLSSLALSPLQVSEGSIFEWPADPDIPDTEIVSFNWEQISGVPITILQGNAKTLVADSPFVAQPEKAEFRVSAIDKSGNTAETIATVTVLPFEPTFVSLQAVTDLPANLLPYPVADLSFAVVPSDDMSIPSDSEKPSLAVARDGAGLVLLSLANGDGGLLGEPSGEVTFSIESTAVILVALSAGETIPSLTNERIFQIKNTANFPDLVEAIRSLLVFDKNFLERIDRYPDLRNAITRVVGNLVPPPGLFSRPTMAATGSLTPLEVDDGLGQEKDGFFCTPITLWPCSPWNIDPSYNVLDVAPPWNWFGDAKGLETFLPDDFIDWVKLSLVAGRYALEKYAELLSDATSVPFLANSRGTDEETNRSVHGIANPTFINYAMEAYRGSGQRFWRLTPRNSTMVQKLLNSGAALRTERSGLDKALSPEVDRIAFHRYRFTLASLGADQAVDHAAWVSLLNFLNVTVSAANIFSDFSGLLKALQNIDVSDADNVLACATEVFASIDLYNPADTEGLYGKTLELIGGNGLSAIETLLSSANCGNIALNGGKKLASLILESKFNIVADALVTKMTLGGKALFDAANDFVPVVTSYFASNARSVEYFIEWGMFDAQTPYIRRVTKTQLPTAAFEATQLSGTQIRFDAAESFHDPATALIYRWGLVSDLNGSNWQPLGEGVVLDYTFPAAGEYLVQLEIEDGLGFVDYMTSRITVEAGVVPTIAALQCALTGTQLTMRLTVVDPDQRIESISWYPDAGSMDGAVATPASTTEVVMDVVPNAGGNWAWVDLNLDDGKSIARSCWTEAVNQGLALHYRFDGTLDDDASGRNAVAGGEPDYVAGRIGSAVSLDGVDDYIKVADLVGLVGQGRPWTVAFWSNRNVLNSRDFSGADGGSGARQFTISSGGYVKITSAAETSADWRVDFSPVATGVWNHLSVTWKPGGPLRVYMNGAFAGEDVIGGSAEFLPLSQPVIGALFRQGALSQFSKGLIDDFRIYDRQLTDAEVLQLANPD